MLGSKRPDQEELLEQVKSEMFGMENPGFCTACGEWSLDDCEPDAENYPCPICEEPAVYGAEQMLLLTVA